MFRKFILPVGMLAAVCSIAHAQGITSGPLTLDFSFAAREAYDSNVMLQSQGPLANRGSPVTTLTPMTGLTWVNPLHTNSVLHFDYAPSVCLFSDRPQENHTDHQLTLRYSGSQDRWSWDAATSCLIVDGPDTPFFFGSPAGSPALGAPAVRDRRSQLLFRGNYKTQYTADTWFARPVFNLYSVDYHIQQTTAPGFCNYVNRSDYNAGFDTGLLMLSNLWAVAGYRYGFQEQGKILTSPVTASNRYQRALAGAEGAPLPWLKFNVLAGPDFRNFSDDAPSDLDHRVRVYAEAAATATFTPADELCLAAKRWTLPSSVGKTVYDDTMIDLSYRHNFTSQLLGRVGFKTCGGEWESVHRDDWVFSPRAIAEYKLDPHWTLETGYQFEAGRSADRSLDGRDYDRHLTWIGFRFDL